MHKEKTTYLQVIPQKSTQKHSKFAITDMQEKPVDRCCGTARASTLASAIILRT